MLREFGKQETKSHFSIPLNIIMCETATPEEECFGRFGCACSGKYRSDVHGTHRNAKKKKVKIPSEGTPARGQ